MIVPDIEYINQPFHFTNNFDHHQVQSEEQKRENKNYRSHYNPYYSQYQPQIQQQPTPPSINNCYPYYFYQNTPTQISNPPSLPIPVPTLTPGRNITNYLVNNNMSSIKNYNYGGGFGYGYSYCYNNENPISSNTTDFNGYDYENINMNHAAAACCNQTYGTYNSYDNGIYDNYIYGNSVPMANIVGENRIKVSNEPIDTLTPPNVEGQSIKKLGTIPFTNNNNETFTNWENEIIDDEIRNGRYPPLPTPYRGPIEESEPEPEMEKETEQESENENENSQNHETIVEKYKLNQLIHTKISGVIHGQTHTYTLVELIGNGSFAAVFTGCREDGKKFAIKCIPKADLNEEQLANQLLEAETLIDLGCHPNILSLHHIIDNEKFLFLVLDLCDIDLYDVLTQDFDGIKKNEYGGLEEKEVSYIFNHISEAILYCHDHGIYHRDLKPENILLRFTAGQRKVNGHDYEVKLTDFGLCSKNDFCEAFGCGSLRYIPPECINDNVATDFIQENVITFKEWEDETKNDTENFQELEEENDPFFDFHDKESVCIANKHNKNSRNNVIRDIGYSAKANDAWAMGIILINLLFGRNPWYSASLDDECFMAFVKDDSDFLMKKFGFTHEFNELVKKIFAFRPCDRYDLRQILDHFNRIEQYYDPNNCYDDDMVSNEVTSTSNVVATETSTVETIEKKNTSSNFTLSIVMKDEEKIKSNEEEDKKKAKVIPPSIKPKIDSLPVMSNDNTIRYHSISSSYMNWLTTPVKENTFNPNEKLYNSISSDSSGYLPNYHIKTNVFPKNSSNPNGFSYPSPYPDSKELDYASPVSTIYEMTNKKEALIIEDNKVEKEEEEIEEEEEKEEENVLISYLNSNSYYDKSLNPPTTSSTTTNSSFKFKKESILDDDDTDFKSNTYVDMEMDHYMNTFSSASTERISGNTICEDYQSQDNSYREVIDIDPDEEISLALNKTSLSSNTLDPIQDETCYDFLIVNENRKNIIRNERETKWQFMKSSPKDINYGKNKSCKTYRKREMNAFENNFDVSEESTKIEKDNERSNEELIEDLHHNDDEMFFYSDDSTWEEYSQRYSQPKIEFDLSFYEEKLKNAEKEKWDNKGLLAINNEKEEKKWNPDDNKKNVCQENEEEDEILECYKRKEDLSSIQSAKILKSELNSEIKNDYYYPKKESKVQEEKIGKNSEKDQEVKEKKKPLNYYSKESEVNSMLLDEKNYQNKGENVFYFNDKRQYIKNGHYKNNNNNNNKNYRNNNNKYNNINNKNNTTNNNMNYCKNNNKKYNNNNNNTKKNNYLSKSYNNKNNNNFNNYYQKGNKNSVQVNNSPYSVQQMKNENNNYFNNYGYYHTYNNNYKYSTTPPTYFSNYINHHKTSSPSTPPTSSFFDNIGNHNRNIKYDYQKKSNLNGNYISNETYQNLSSSPYKKKQKIKMNSNNNFIKALKKNKINQKNSTENFCLGLPFQSNII